MLNEDERERGSISKMGKYSWSHHIIDQLQCGDILWYLSIKTYVVI
jgi:hypothetical protein